MLKGNLRMRNTVNKSTTKETAENDSAFTAEKTKPQETSPKSILKQKSEPPVKFSRPRNQTNSESNSSESLTMNPTKNSNPKKGPPVLKHLLHQKFNRQNLDPKENSSFDKTHWTRKKCHKTVMSIMASESNFSNYQGFLNLTILLLILSNFRVFLDNLYTFGNRMQPLVWVKILFDIHTYPNLIIFIMGLVCCYIAVFIEKLMIQNKLERGYKYHCLNLFFYWLYSTLSVLINEPTPIVSMGALGFVVVIELKLWSYAQTNRWYYESLESKKRENVKIGKRVKEKF